MKQYWINKIHYNKNRFSLLKQKKNIKSDQMKLRKRILNFVIWLKALKQSCEINQYSHNKTYLFSHNKTNRMKKEAWKKHGNYRKETQLFGKTHRKTCKWLALNCAGKKKLKEFEKKYCGRKHF